MPIDADRITRDALDDGKWKKMVLNNILFFNPVVYGSTYVLTKAVVESMPSFFYVSIRFLIAFLFLIPFFGNLKLLTWEKAKISIVAAVLFFMANASQTAGLRLTTSSKAGFITGLNVVLIPILLAIFFKKKPRPIIWVSVLLAIAGIFILTFSGVQPINAGDALVFLCAVSFSFYVIYLDRKKENIDIIPFTIVQLAVITTLSTFASLLFDDWGSIFGHNLSVTFAPRNILTLLYVGGAATSLTFLVQIIGQQRTPPSKTALILSLEPVFAAIFGIMLSDETLTLTGAIGFCFVFAAILLVKMFKK